MDRIRITGGRPLEGVIPISGAKNATLPLMIASLLTEDTLILENVPHLADVVQLQRILNNHGVDVMALGLSDVNSADDQGHYTDEDRIDEPRVDRAASKGAFSPL